MNEQPKRQRSSNFSNDEKIELLNLVAKYKNIIENKKTDKVSTKEKNEAWEKVTQEFNAMSPDGSYRSSESLKKFYENKKKEVRKAAAQENMEIKKTGGGTCPKIKTDPAYDLLLSIINTKTVFGLNNPFDCDNSASEAPAGTPTESVESLLELNRSNEYEVVQTENQYPVEADCVVITSEQGKKDSDAVKNLNYCHQSKQESISSSSQNNWSKVTPVDLQRTKSVELRRKINARRRPGTVVKALTTSEISEKYTELLDKKLEIASFEKKNCEDQIAKRDEEHLLKTTLLKMDIALKNKELQSNGIAPFKYPLDNAKTDRNKPSN